MKKIILFLIIIGGVVGLFISLLDSMISYADTAPINEQIGMDIPDIGFFIQKTVFYIILGGVLGFFSGILVLFIKKKIRK